MIYKIIKNIFKLIYLESKNGFEENTKNAFRLIWIIFSSLVMILVYILFSCIDYFVIIEARILRYIYLIVTAFAIIGFYYLFIVRYFNLFLKNEEYKSVLYFGRLNLLWKLVAFLSIIGGVILLGRFLLIDFSLYKGMFG
ncbi:MAG TPA: hypothetical protein VIM75_02295 [Ohtaekwangia sp.]|uniref:hypothetical protein n=1 Tax=Ohtaekwangia sp. TaxID=2066019 RepID=UPI002F9552BD